MSDNDRPQALLGKAFRVANFTDPFVRMWREPNPPPEVPLSLRQAMTAISDEEFRCLQMNHPAVAEPLRVIAQVVKRLAGGQPPCCTVQDLLAAARAIREAGREILETEQRSQLTGLGWAQDLAQTADNPREPGAAPSGDRTPLAMLDSLLNGAKLRRQQEDEGRQIAEERRRRLNEQAASRAHLAAAFGIAYAFPGEESQQGRKPCPDGFRRWAERFLALGAVLRECDEAIEGLRLMERLQTVAARAAPEAMKYACALLLLASEGKADAVASALTEANGDGELRRFVLWLPFILDNLWHPFPSEDGLIRVAESPDGTSREENQQAEQAFGWRPLILPTDRPPPPTPVDRILDQATRRQELLEQLRHIEERLEARISRLREALCCFAAVMPSEAPLPGGAGHTTPSDRREALADALLSVCQAVREGEFHRGMEQILNGGGDAAGDNDRLAIDLYRRGWRGDRQGIVELLGHLDLLPARGDNFDPTAPCQLRVWDTVRSRFGVILPWPAPLGIHPWHPDAVEAQRVQAQLAPQHRQEGQKAPPAQRARPDVLVEREGATMSATPNNPFRDLLNLAQKFHSEEIYRASVLTGKRPETPDEWGPRLQAREAELQALVDDALRAADRTGFGVEEVERRVNALAKAVRAILLWQRDARFPSREERERMEWSGELYPGVSDYLSLHYGRMMEVWQPVHALAVRADGSGIPPGQATLQVDAREVPMEAPAGTPSPLREAFDAVAEALFQAAEMRRCPPNGRPLFEDQARALSDARKTARERYGEAELLLQAVTDDNGRCAPSRGPERHRSDQRRLRAYHA
jgi:hypothetical protein